MSAQALCDYCGGALPVPAVSSLDQEFVYCSRKCRADDRDRMTAGDDPRARQALGMGGQ